MEFDSANPSVVRSIKQRVLLNAWLRALRQAAALPALADFDPDGIADELADMMGFDVEGDGDSARFLITHEGTRLTATYGNDHVDPDKRTNRYLDDAIGPDRYARVLPSYRACLARKRPTYSVSMVQDADGKDVSYERLLLPFGSGERVEQIVGSYKAISIEGGFKVNNLMGVSPKARAGQRDQAVIDLDLVPSARRPALLRRRHRAELALLGRLTDFLRVDFRLEADQQLAAEIEHRPLDHRRLRQHQRERLALVQAFLVGVGQFAKRGAGAIEQRLPAEFVAPAL